MTSPRPCSQAVVPTVREHVVRVAQRPYCQVILPLFLCRHAQPEAESPHLLQGRTTHLDRLRALPLTKHVLILVQDRPGWCPDSKGSAFDLFLAQRLHGEQQSLVGAGGHREHVVVVLHHAPFNRLPDGQRRGCLRCVVRLQAVFRSRTTAHRARQQQNHPQHTPPPYHSIPDHRLPPLPCLSQCQSTMCRCG